MQGDIITYEYWGSLYINMTNRCDCRCIFCIRDQDASALGGLWLREEPTKEEVLEDILSQDLRQYEEIVFCGFGEPMERPYELLEVAKYIKATTDMKIRINTNGLVSLIHPTFDLYSMRGLIDSVSISLNASE